MIPSSMFHALHYDKKKLTYNPTFRVISRHTFFIWEELRDSAEQRSIL